MCCWGFAAVAEFSDLAERLAGQMPQVAAVMQRALVAEQQQVPQVAAVGLLVAFVVLAVLVALLPTPLLLCAREGLIP